MKRLKLLGKYSKSQKFRKVNTKKRNIFHKIIASKRGQTFSMEKGHLAMEDIDMMEDGSCCEENYSKI